MMDEERHGGVVGGFRYLDVSRGMGILDENLLGREIDQERLVSDELSLRVRLREVNWYGPGRNSYFSSRSIGHVHATRRLSQGDYVERMVLDLRRTIRLKEGTVPPSRLEIMVRERGEAIDLSVKKERRIGTPWFSLPYPSKSGLDGLVQPNWFLHKTY